MADVYLWYIFYDINFYSNISMRTCIVLLLIMNHNWQRLWSLSMQRILIVSEDIFFIYSFTHWHHFFAPFCFHTLSQKHFFMIFFLECFAWFSLCFFLDCLHVFLHFCQTLHKFTAPFLTNFRPFFLLWFLTTYSGICIRNLQQLLLQQLLHQQLFLCLLEPFFQLPSFRLQLF